MLVARARLITVFGGAPGLRDRGALEAALARPRSGYYTDILAEAAALLESLWQNHPFVDGNKRTAITVVAAFLRINGLRLEFDDLAGYHFLIGLAETGQLRFARLDEWLRRHVVPTTPSG